MSIKKSAPDTAMSQDGSIIKFYNDIVTKKVLFVKSLSKGVKK